MVSKPILLERGKLTRKVVNKYNIHRSERRYWFSRSSVRHSWFGGFLRWGNTPSRGTGLTCHLTSAPISLQRKKSIKHTSNPTQKNKEYKIEESYKLATAPNWNRLIEFGWRSWSQGGARFGG